jgi:hypothetical protein
MFSKSPATPPSNYAQGPSLSNWGKHEPVLSTATSEAVSGEVLCKTGACSELCQVFLDDVVSHKLLWVDYPVRANVWEQVVIGFHLTAKLSFKKVDPHTEIGVHINLWSFPLFVDLVSIT